jgi:hypothetical protein
MSIITAVSATGLAAGLVFSGVTGASASNADITLPSGGVLAQRVTTYCNRVPDLIERADKAQTRISAGAETKGSLAWLKDKRNTAVSKKHPRVVHRLDKVIARRTARLQKLPTVEANLATAKTECAALDLPAPSTSPSTSSPSPSSVPSTSGGDS